MTIEEATARIVELETENNTLKTTNTEYETRINNLVAFNQDLYKRVAVVPDTPKKQETPPPSLEDFARTLKI